MKLWCTLWIVKIVFCEFFCTNRVAAVSSVVATGNVALGKRCTMSRVFYWETEDVEYDIFNNSCNAANNGNTNTINTQGNCISTHWFLPTASWTVYLGKPYIIHKVTIYPRSGSESEMTSVQVRVGSNPPQPVPVPTNGHPVDVLFSPPQIGQTVTVFRHIGGHNYMRFCEVQVWAVPDRRDVAEGKPCDMSPWYYWETESESYQNGWRDVKNNTCSAAINGNTNNNYTKGNCIRTHWEVDNPFWTVFLRPGHFEISDIKIFASGDPNGQKDMTNVRVLIDGSEVMRFPRYTGDVSDHGIQPITDIPFSRPRIAHSVTVLRDDISPTNQGGAPFTYLRFCEVQVLGTCASGYYGDACNQTCECRASPGRTLADTCSPEDGQCMCTDGWKPPNCNECAPGRYEKSSDCQKRCGAGCSGGTCSDDGTCVCRPRWQTPKCDRCDADHYGQSADCVHQCGAGPGCAGCNEDGTCKACKPHFAQIPSCDHCDTQHYGSDCSSECGQCVGQGGCGRDDGHCLAGCQDGWKPPTCVDRADGQSKSGDSGNLVGPIVGAILGAGVIIAIGLIASQCWMKRRRTHSNSEAQSTSSGLSPGTQEQQRDKNTVAMDEIPSAAAETGSLAAPTTNRRLPASSPEDGPRVQSKISSDVYEVIRENNYDSLHPYVNPDRDWYTNIKDQ